MASAWVEPPRINKNGTKSYKVNWRDHSGVRRSKTFNKARLANAFRADMNSKLNRHEFIPIKAIPFTKLCEEWFKVKEPNLRPATVNMYRTHINLRLLPEFGAFLVTGIAPMDVEKFAAKLAKTDLAPETQRKTLMTLKSILDKAIQWGYLTKNPAVFVKAPKQQRKEIEVLSTVEMRLLIDSADERYRAIIATGCHTGLRISELFGLKWCDINFAKGILKVRQSSQNGVFFELKSDTSRRDVPMPTFLIDMLFKHLAWQREWIEENKDNLVFTNLRGRHLNYQNFTRRYFEPALQKAGLRRITPHAMRHSYATTLLTAGEPIQNVSKLLGHADSSITLRVYAHVLPDSALSTARRIDEIFGFSLPKSTTSDCRL
jgi:integrase